MNERETLRINEKGHLELGGADTVELAKKFGTPLYVFDEKHIRNMLGVYRDTILEEYGRVGCTAAQLETIDPRDVLRTRRGAFGGEALVKDRAAFARKYPMLLVERTTLEDIMLFVGKGEAK